MNNPLKNADQELEKGQGPDERGSVFDFIYADFERIGVLTSQFGQLGDLQGIQHSETATEHTTKDGTVKATGNAVFIKGDMGVERGIGRSGTESQSRSYDPRWVKALEFMDYAQSSGSLHQLGLDVPLGGLVQAKGRLIIQDYDLARKMWDIPQIQRLLLAGAVEEGIQEIESLIESGRLSKAQKSEQRREIKKEVEISLAFIGAMPHSSRLRLVDGDTSCWGILRSQELLGSVSDFSLTFGGNIPGEWHAIGVLDARPYVDEHKFANHGEGVSALLDTVEPLVRSVMGRPNADYAFTPLVVFRRLEGL